MPYSDPEAQRRYQREWCARRRADWLAENGPCVDCGSTENLEIDHVDPLTKHAELRRLHNNAIWSWSQARREAELAKCVVRCHDCHLAKTTQGDEHVRGSSVGTSKLTEEEVKEIRRRVRAGASRRGLAPQYGVDEATIRRVVSGAAWSHV